MTAGAVGVTDGRAEGAERLSDLALRSKGHWGPALDDAQRTAGSRGWTTLRIESDPGAEGFYLARGARRVGSVPSGSVAGRELPLLELPVPF